MISTNFAPNEEGDDAFLSLSLILKPWLWQKKITFYQKNKILSLLNFPSNFYFFPFLTGRAALFHFLKVLNFSPGSEILVQGFTCEAVVLPILANNLKPIYVDIEKNTFSMDYSSLVSKISPRSRALILQHTFGFTPYFREKILNFCKRNRLVLIEDVAHGFDSKITSSIKQSIPFNFLFSFGRSKVFSSVFGGGIITNWGKIIKELEKEEKILSFPQSFFILKMLLYKPFSVLVKKTYDFGLGKMINLIWKKSFLFISEITQKEKKGNYDWLLDKAYPFVLGELLINQLKKAKKINQRRRQITEFYKKSFADNYPAFPLLRYPFLIDNPLIVIENLKKKGIFLGNWYNQVVAPKNISLKKMGYKNADCPQAEKISHKIINLPTNISLKEAKQIVKILNGS